MWRFIPAAQISPTKPGNRLSAIIASQFATSELASSGRASISASSRKLTMARSPRWSIDIAEIGVVMPSRRGHCTHAIFSRAASANIVSPTVSMPGGPPNGPAKLARAPRCAIATAAFAALPPLTVRNSLACVFTSGRGNDPTRNTRSSTAIPVHSTCLRTSTEDIVLLDPGADNVMRNRDRRRDRDPLRMLAPEHQHDLVSGKPTRVLKFLAVDGNFDRGGLRVATDHQRHRERPGLRGEIFHVPARDAGFLHGLAPGRFLDALARFDKSRKARPHVGDEAPGAAEQAPLAIDRQH